MIVKNVFIQLLTLELRLHTAPFCDSQMCRLFSISHFLRELSNRSSYSGNGLLQKEQLQEDFAPQQTEILSSILLRCQLKDPYHSAEEHFSKARQEHSALGLKIGTLIQNRKKKRSDTWSKAMKLDFKNSSFFYTTGHQIRFHSFL